MQPVFADFEKKVQEIEKYFALLHALEQPGAQLYFPARASRRNRKVDSDWPTILRAGAFLVLYNLIESSIREGFAAVYDKIRSEGRTFNDLRKEFREIWIDQQHKSFDAFSASQKNYVDKAKDMIESIVTKVIVEMDGDRLPISGNLDGASIQSVCGKHGITYKIHRAAQGGWRLETVRTQRNALAHGNVSFVECGRDYTTAQVDEIKKQAVIFVRSVLTNLKRFAEREKYVDEAAA